MREIEQEGRTVEEAIDLAVEKLEVERDSIDVEVLEEGNKGLLGLLGKKARVRVQVKEDLGQKAYEFLSDLVDTMNLEAEVELLEKNEDKVELNLTGPNLGILIGRRGRTLDSLQFIVELAINKNSGEDRYHVVIDAEGYRERRRDTLRNLAQRLAQKAKRRQKKVVLEPMPPHERRIIHLALQDEEGVQTHSEGRDPHRKVVISCREEDAEDA